MSKNDDKILLMKKQVNDKKELLSKIKKFSPKTNCSMEFNGTRYNLNVLNKDQLLKLLIEINMYDFSYSELGIEEEFLISGYSTIDWMIDLHGKLALASKKEEESKLRAMELKLDKLLSDDKKVELELDEIASLLK